MVSATFHGAGSSIHARNQEVLRIKIGIHADARRNPKSLSMYRIQPSQYRIAGLRDTSKVHTNPQFLLEEGEYPMRAPPSFHGFIGQPEIVKTLQTHIEGAIRLTCPPKTGQV